MKSTRIATALCVLLLPMIQIAPALAELGKTTAPPRPTHDATIAAQQKLKEASAALMKANGAFGRISGTLRKTLESSQEWIDANKELTTARAANDTAHAAVVAKLQASSDYAAAVQAKQKAEAGKDAIVKDSAATPQQRMDAANSVMEAGKKVTALEVAAAASDPKCVEAKKQLADASAKMLKLTTDFETTLKDKPEWQSAKQEVQTADAELKKSKEELAAAQQSDAAADLAWRQQVADAAKKAQSSTYKK